jgi:hypothetical protein
MAEKRGETEKLVNNYNTAGVLEVYIPKLKDWYRVTAKDFRSFDGSRRITDPTVTEKGNPWVELKTYEYTGPVYVWGTNKVVTNITNSGSIVTSMYWDKQIKVSSNRG